MGHLLHTPDMTGRYFTGFLAVVGSAVFRYNRLVPAILTSLRLQPIVSLTVRPPMMMLCRKTTTSASKDGVPLRELKAERQLSIKRFRGVPLHSTIPLKWEGGEEMHLIFLPLYPHTKSWIKGSWYDANFSPDV